MNCDCGDIKEEINQFFSEKKVREKEEEEKDFSLLNRGMWVWLNITLL